MIIGITGTLGAGKGTVVEFLKKKGFGHYSVRGFLTEEISRRGIDLNRENMVSVANDLRAKFGPSYIVEELYKESEKNGGSCVIESIRCPGEVEALKEKRDFVLFAVDADVEVRYARIIERGSSTDGVSFDKFVEQEQMEMNSSDPNKQNLKECIVRADYVFKNDWTVGELYEKVARALEQVGRGKGRLQKGAATIVAPEGKFIRPNWDEYFVDIMQSVSKRVTCDRARAGGGGCVIVKDKHILVTGYVGSPPGCSHCDDVGHQFKKIIHEDNKVTNHCVRTTHSEQNAICQAAKLGISLDGSTLYVFMAPCYTCAKLIITAGIKRVVSVKDYHASADSKNLFKEAGVKFELLNEEVQQYKNM